jgi:hypothetical protein
VWDKLKVYYLEKNGDFEIENSYYAYVYYKKIIVKFSYLVLLKLIYIYDVYDDYNSFSYYIRVF